MKQPHQVALIGDANGSISLTCEAPVPMITGDSVLIRTKAVSVNPVDTKMVGPYVTVGAVAGFDFSGVVEQLGPTASKTNIDVGDRVCTVTMGMNPLDPTVGAFAQYTAAVEWSLMKIPPTLSFEEGASLGISFMTTGQALFRSLALPGHPLEPSAQPIPVFVFGGSSATGTAAIQLIRLAGFLPITTCSPHNFDLVKSYGATAVFDYQAPGSSADIRSFTKNNLRYALDCISTTASMEFCYQALGRAGGRYTTLEPYVETVAETRKTIKADWIMGPSMMGKEIAWPKPHRRPADPSMAEFGASRTATLQKLLDGGLIRPHPIAIRQGGLAEVLNGIEDVRSKKVSGKKLVYTV
ncbi:GroES-like protein [Xylariomycetidae sp. FL2044]|nr:GroES-like protein [Xylariomycetidae sp. FL2044]